MKIDRIDVTQSNRSTKIDKIDGLDRLNRQNDQVDVKGKTDKILVKCPLSVSLKLIKSRNVSWPFS